MLSACDCQRTFIRGRRPAELSRTNQQQHIFWEPGSFHNCFSFEQGRRNRQRSSRVAAKRLSKDEVAAGEWAALLKLGEAPATDDGVTVAQLNEICNKGLKLMLREDRKGLMDYRDELNRVGRTFSSQNDLQGATFIYALFKMSENVIVNETENLEGMYADALQRVFSILEDSGWKLLREGEEEEEDAVTVDDLPMLKYM